MLAVALTAVVLGLAWVVAARPDLWRIVLAGMVLANLLILSARWPRLAILGAFLFLPFVALIRRLLIEDAGFVSNDPLLLVGPLLAVVLLLRYWLLERKPLLTDSLSKLVFALLIVTCFQVLNPLGAGLYPGLVGLLFVGVPLLWFFVGRELGDRRTSWLILGAVILVAVLVAAYGLWQTELRPVLPPWDAQWFETNGYSALVVGNEYTAKLRPFSTFSSNAEYGTYVAIGAAVAVAFALHGRLLALLALPVLLPAIFFAGSRGIMVLSLAGVVVALALKARSALTATVAVVVGVAVVGGAFTALSGQLERAAGRSGDPLAARTVRGLTDPLSDQQSTLNAHWASFTSAIETGFTEPLGSGAGATNLAADQLAEGRIETDNDLADAFRNLGFAGGLLYFAVILVALRKTCRRAIRLRDPIGVAVAGLLVANLGFWLEGGHYAVSALTWFLMGAATRPQDEVTPGYVAPIRKRRAGTARATSSSALTAGRRPTARTAPHRPPPPAPT